MPDQEPQTTTFHWLTFVAGVASLNLGCGGESDDSLDHAAVADTADVESAETAINPPAPLADDGVRPL